jgi:hypothetical protein
MLLFGLIPIVMTLESIQQEGAVRQELLGLQCRDLKNPQWYDQDGPRAMCVDPRGCQLHNGQYPGISTKLLYQPKPDWPSQSY